MGSRLALSCFVEEGATICTFFRLEDAKTTLCCLLQDVASAHDPTRRDSTWRRCSLCPFRPSSQPNVCPVIPLNIDVDSSLKHQDNGGCLCSRGWAVAGFCAAGPGEQSVSLCAGEPGTEPGTAPRTGGLRAASTVAGAVSLRRRVTCPHRFVVYSCVCVCVSAYTHAKGQAC